MDRKTISTINRNNNIKLTIFCIVGILLFTLPIIVSASDGTSGIITAGASSIATGDETYTNTKTVIDGNSVMSSATSRAKAENGRTATVIAVTWVSWLDKMTAYASATATTTSEPGKIAWAEAIAVASASEDGSKATTKSSVGIGDWNNDNNGNGGNNNNNNGGTTVIGGDTSTMTVDTIYRTNKDTSNKRISFGGFNFGKSDLERYCVYKLQLTDNDTSNDEHARYYQKIIAWDYRYNQDEFDQFEKRYNIDCTQVDINVKPNEVN